MPKIAARFFGVFLVLIGLVVAFQNCSRGSGNGDGGLNALLEEQPTLQLLTALAERIGVNEIAIEFSATTNPLKNIVSIQCALDEGEIEDCISPYILTDLEDGSHNVRILVTDDQGATNTLFISFVVDTTPPELTLVAAPAAVTGSANQSIEFSAVDASSGVVSFECSFQGADFEACESPVSINDQTDGSYQFAIRALDDLGNTSNAATANWRVDMTAPSLEFIATPRALDNQSTANFQLSAVDNGLVLTEFLCSIDGGEFQSCLNNLDYSDLENGSHTFSFRARDSVGNLSEPLTYNWTIDTQPPIVVLSSISIASVTVENFGRVQFQVVGVEDVQTGLRCFFDSEERDCPASVFPGEDLMDLSDGFHTYRLIATDMAGNTTTFDHSFEVVTRRGEGPAIQSIQAMTLNSSGRKLYVADGVLAAILEIDTSTGNKKIITGQVQATGLHLNADESKLFAIDRQNNSLIEVDLSTSNRETIISNFIGTGPNYLSLEAFDLTALTDFYLLDNSTSIVRVNTNDNIRTLHPLRSSPSGARIWPADIIYSSDNDRLYAFARWSSTTNFVEIQIEDSGIDTYADVSAQAFNFSEIGTTLNPGALVSDPSSTDMFFSQITGTSQSGIYFITRMGEIRPLSINGVGSGIRPRFFSELASGVNYIYGFDRVYDAIIKIDRSTGDREIISR